VGLREYFPVPRERLVLRGSGVDDDEPDDGDGGHNARANEDRGKRGKEEEGAFESVTKIF